VHCCSSASTAVLRYVWNANYMYGALDVNLIWEKAHSSQGSSTSSNYVHSYTFALNAPEFREYKFNFKYDVHRCTPQSSFYSWPPWVFLSEPLLPSPFTCPSPPPVQTHVHICPICKKGMLARVFPHWCDHALQLLTSIQKIAIPNIPLQTLGSPVWSPFEMERCTSGSGYLNLPWEQWPCPVHPVSSCHFVYVWYCIIYIQNPEVF